MVDRGDCQELFDSLPSIVYNKLNYNIDKQRKGVVPDHLRSREEGMVKAFRAASGKPPWSLKEKSDSEGSIGPVRVIRVVPRDNLVPIWD